MIKVPEAARRLKKRHPDVTIKGCALFDANHYLFVAPSGNGPDFNDPYYLVSIDKGEVYSFAPIDYLDEFTEALDKRSIDLRRAGLR